MSHSGQGGVLSVRSRPERPDFALPRLPARGLAPERHRLVLHPRALDGAVRTAFAAPVVSASVAFDK